LVAGNKISVSGNNHTLTPWDRDGLLAFSNYPGSCAQGGVQFNGNGHEYEGIVFAPRGHIEMSGNTNTTFHGSLIADTIKLNGNGVDVTWNDEFVPGTDSIKLVE
jgi:hypothetical protein